MSTIRINHFREFIYTMNNIIAYGIYLILRSFAFGKKNQNAKSYLFVNTGKIGDLVLASVIFENSSLFPENDDIYFLLKKEYKDLYAGYNGRIKVIGIDYNRYRWNILYRLKILTLLRRLNLRNAIQMNFKRGISHDEIVLLSGAENTIAVQSDKIIHNRLFNRKVDQQYSKIISLHSGNEYDKNIEILKFLFPDKNLVEKTAVYIPENNIKAIDAKYIVCAPFSDDRWRDWDIEKYKMVIKNIIEQTSYQMVVMGSPKQYLQLEEIRSIAPKRIINTSTSKSLLENISIIQNAKLYIGNDSGMTHVAKAADVPMIAIVGGGKYDIFFPYLQSDHDWYKYSKMDCFGCEWRCIYTVPHCIQDVSVDQILNIVSKYTNR